MVDISSDFKQSFNTLIHHKRIIIPTMLSIIIPFFLVYLFFNLSGINPILREVSQMKTEYDSIQIDYLTKLDNVNDPNYTTKLLVYSTKYSDTSKETPYDKGFMAYMVTQGYDPQVIITKLLTMNNLILLVTFVLLGGFISYYLTCMSFALISLSIKEHNLGVWSIVHTTNRFLFRYFTLQFFVNLIILVPFIIILGIAISLYFINIILGVLASLLFLLLFFAYVFYIGLRLAFATPLLYLEEDNPKDSIKDSYRMTKGHIKQVLIIFGIIYCMNFFINSFVATPIGNSSEGMMFGSGGKVILNMLILLFFIVVESAILTIETVFLFYSMIDLKKIEEFVPGKKN